MHHDASQAGLQRRLAPQRFPRVRQRMSLLPGDRFASHSPFRGFNLQSEGRSPV